MTSAGKIFNIPHSADLVMTIAQHLHNHTSSSRNQKILLLLPSKRLAGAVAGAPSLPPNTEILTYLQFYLYLYRLSNTLTPGRTTETTTELYKLVSDSTCRTVLSTIALQPKFDAPLWRAAYEYFHYGLRHSDLDCFTDQHTLFSQVISELENMLQRRRLITRPALVKRVAELLADFDTDLSQHLRDSIRNRYSAVYYLASTNTSPSVLGIVKWLYLHCHTNIIVRGLDKDSATTTLLRDHPQYHLHLLLCSITDRAPAAHRNQHSAPRLAIRTPQHLRTVQAVQHIAPLTASDTSAFNVFDAERQSTIQNRYLLYKTANVVEEADLISEEINKSGAKTIGIVTESRALALLLLERLQPLAERNEIQLTNRLCHDSDPNLELFSLVASYLSGADEAWNDIMYHNLATAIPKEELGYLEHNLKRSSLPKRNAVISIDSAKEIPQIYTLYGYFQQQRQTDVSTVAEFYQLHLALCKLLNPALESNLFVSVEERLRKIYSFLDDKIDIKQYGIIARSYAIQVTKQAQPLQSTVVPSNAKNVILSNFTDSYFDQYEQIIICGMQQDCFPGKIADHGFISFATRQRHRYNPPTLNDLGYKAYDLCRALSQGTLPPIITYSNASYNEPSRTATVSTVLHLLPVTAQVITQVATPSCSMIPPAAEDCADYASPPLETRPTTLSPTAIAKLVENPYLYYLEYILGLRRQEDDLALLSREFGIITHQTIAKLTPIAQQKIRKASISNDAQTVAEREFASHFSAIFHKSIAEHGSGHLWPLWERRVHNIALAVYHDNVTLEKAYDHSLETGATVCEGWGELALTLSNGYTIKLRTRFDRLDILPSMNKYILTDYKTGELPSSQAALGQLQLEGLIVLRGECREAGAHQDQLISIKQPAEILLRYAQVDGKDSRCTVKSCKFSAAETHDQLLQLLEYYYVEQGPYLAQSLRESDAPYRHLVKQSSRLVHHSLQSTSDTMELTRPSVHIDIGAKPLQP